MDENRFDDIEDIGQEQKEQTERTRELDSILGEFGAHGGITPREEFIENNSADMQKTRQMDSLYDPQEEASPAPNPVKRRRKKKKKQINHTRTMGQIFLGVLLSVTAICVGIYLASQMIVALQDFTGMSKKSRESVVEITDSMSVDDIAQLLHDKGVIKMPSLFKTYLKISDKESGFLNGEFTLNSNMSYSNIEIALKTKKKYTETISIMIPEGYTAQQVAQLLEENYVCRAADFLRCYKNKLDKYDFEEGIPDSPDRFNMLEGYLFPDTYEFYVIDDLKKDKNFDTYEYAKQAADKMYKNFESKITKQMKARMEELGLTLDQTVILASLIQKEGTDEENMSMISSVFHNRLENPAEFPNLQTDTTTNYIDEVIKPSITADSSDLYDDIINAYDSYKCGGLPAGAVCNPGLMAINAALYPAETDFYYFLASSDGVFYWARTHEEHEENIVNAALHEEE